MNLSMGTDTHLFRVPYGAIVAGVTRRERSDLWLVHLGFAADLHLAPSTVLSCRPCSYMTLSFRREATCSQPRMMMRAKLAYGSVAL